MIPAEGLATADQQTHQERFMIAAYRWVNAREIDVDVHNVEFSAIQQVICDQ